MHGDFDFPESRRSHRRRGSDSMVAIGFKLGCGLIVACVVGFVIYLLLGWVFANLAAQADPDADLREWERKTNRENLRYRP